MSSKKAAINYWDGGFMSGGKKNTGKIKEVQLSGKVVIKKTSEGSKSERNAVILQTESKEYFLRKLGGNPFHDASLEELAGKSITATGMLDRNLLLATDIKEL
ncbi:MAG TPA: hypothetical protein VFV68_02950 [Agriterribacter sp.]|nr:hypothetical protein [Agriterribacter sp.]